jgi:hypothetical protein
LEAVERDQGIDFGELVREKRRTRGLPLPIVDRVLPVCVEGEPLTDAEETQLGATPAEQSGSRQHRAEGRVADAWGRLHDAEVRGQPARVVRQLEEAFHTEVATLAAIQHANGAGGAE